MISSGNASAIKRAVLVAACAISILVGAWLLRPYTYVAINHAVQLPLVQAVRNPDLYQNDPFVETLDTYSSLYWRAVAHISLLPTEVTLGVIYFITVVGGLAAAALLGKALAPASTIAPWVAAVGFGLGLEPFIGFGTITRAYPEQTSLAVVFLVLSLAAIAARRPWLAAISFAAGFLCNQLYGVHAALYIGIFALLALLYRMLDRRWLAAALLGVVLTTPALLLGAETASALEFRDGYSAATWAEALHYAGGGHFYLMDNPRSRMVAMAAALLLVIAVARKDADPWRRILALSTVVAAVAWLLVSIILAYVLAPSAALMVQAVRAGDLFCVFGLIYVSGRFATKFEQDRSEGAAALVPIAGIIGLFLLYRLVTPVPAAIGLTCMAGSVVFGRWLRNTDIWKIVPAIAAAMLLTVFWELATHPPRTPAFFRVGPSEELQEAAAWARMNTDVDAVFMVSPVWRSSEHAMFRPLSERSLFVAHKDLAAIHWDASYLATFLERMDALGGVADREAGRLHPNATIGRHWRALSDEQLAQVAREYGIDFVVYEARRDTKLPIVFGNAHYKIARFPDA